MRQRVIETWLPTAKMMTTLSPRLWSSSSSSSSTTAVHEESNNNPNAQEDTPTKKQVLASLKREGDNSNVRLQMPRHPHGFRVFPFTWDELQEIVVDTQDLSLLCRSIPQQYEYEVYKIYLQQNWQSTYDHILCSKLGVPSAEVLDDDDDVSSTRQKQRQQRRRAIPLDELPADFPQRSLSPNDFPYYVEEPIQHWVLWILGRPCQDADVEWAKDQLRAKLGPVQEFIHWINPPPLQSIPDIAHVPILCLPAKRSARSG